jgi:branched-chain amino acid transport system ATP-binding protein
MGPVLALDGVSFAIGGVTLTDGVSFSLAPGDRMALVGPNGAGKTTLMNLVSGVHRPTAGRVLLDGVDVTGWSVHRRARAGLARTFQITNLLTSRTVEENLATAVGATGRHRANVLRSWRSMRDVWGPVGELVERSGLGDIRRLRVGDLPYGEQRKLEIVVAVARPATVVMLDEPGAGLTSAEAESLLSLVFNLGDDVAVLFVDHDLELVRRLATRMTLLDVGQVVAEGTPDDVASCDRYREIYLEGAIRARGA